MPSRRKERVINSLVSFRVAKLFLSQVRVLISVHRELKLCFGVEDYSIEVKVVHATIIYYTILCLFVFTRNIHNTKRTQGWSYQIKKEYNGNRRKTVINIDGNKSRDCRYSRTRFYLATGPILLNIPYEADANNVCLIILKTRTKYVVGCYSLIHVVTAVLIF